MAREQKERREKEAAKKNERDQRTAARVQAEAARHQESSSSSPSVYRHRNVNPPPREDNFIPLEMKTSCRIELTAWKMDEVMDEAATLEKQIKLVNLAEVIVTYLYHRKTRKESATKNIIRRDQPPSSPSGVPTRKIAELAEREAKGNRHESSGDKKAFLKPSSSASVTSTKHIVDRNRDDNNGFNKVHKKYYAEAVKGTERPRTEKEGGYTNKGTTKPPFRLPESPFQSLSRRCIPRRYLPQCSNSEPLTGHSSGSDDQEVKTGEIGMSNNRKRTEEVCPHSRIDHDLDRSRTSKPTLHSSKYSIRGILSRNQPRSSTSRTWTRHTAWPNNRGKEKKWIDDRYGNNFYKSKGFRSSESLDKTITDRFWTKERSLKQLPSASGTSRGDYASEGMQRIGNRKKIDTSPVLKHLGLQQSSTYEEKKEEKEKHCGGERSEREDGDSDEGDNGGVS
ncbi:uncharacterized protein A4U43_C01F9030 [Asparagus officinalis]|uniref:Uncharacterized protein n=1 Tax=Asparagus officinalis TaxID=4686 RepID=A0A5P1FN83_ASPOF|nr:uncharacterized protein A4U43_C01F9030 [Asparagus officinalis]